VAATDNPGVPSRPPGRPKASEERLDAIRNEASSTGKVVTGAGRVNADVPIPGAEDYYNLPVLKPPTWTWEVPLYFFVGGIAGMSALIAFVGHVFYADPRMVRVALWLPLVGAGLCPALLISDLGRPLRVLNMLRVFKWRSAMSMGSWILSAFGGAAFLALATNELILYGIQSPFLSPIAMGRRVCRRTHGPASRQLHRRAHRRHCHPSVAREPAAASGTLSHLRTRRFVSNSGTLRLSRTGHASPGIRGGDH
jgi:hypothetical protein